MIVNKQHGSINILIILILIIGLIATVILVKNPVNWFPKAYNTHPSDMDTPTASTKPQVMTGKVLFDQKGVTVWGDENTEVPLGWQDALGNRGVFDQKNLAEEKQQASSNEKTTIATIQRVAIQKDFGYSSPKNTNPSTNNIPVIKQLPNDVVTEDELRERGIEIIQAEKVKIYFRKSAFDKDSLLEEYQKGKGNKLKILATDNPVLAPFYFTDNKYDQYRDVLNEVFKNHPQNLSDVRKQKILELESAMDSWKESNLRQYEDLKRARKIWESFSDDEMVKWGLYPWTTGYTLPPNFSVQQNTQYSDNSLVFLALGERPELNFDLLEISVSISGYSIFLNTISGNTLEINPRDGLSPYQSYPDPSTFEFTDEYKKFGKGKLRGVYKTRQIGFTIRHELSHVWKLTHPTEDPVFDWSESETDLLAGKTLVDGHKKLVNNQDDTGYYVVLQNVPGGYFILY